MSNFMNAGELMMDFISWGYKTPKPLRAGTERRKKREAEQFTANADLYANTPNHPQSRQVKRRILRKHKL